MTDIAKLGFEIDSGPLAKAAVDAKNAAQQIGAVGDATDKLAQKSRNAGQAVTPATQTMQGFGRAAADAAGKMDGLAGALAGAGGNGGLIGNAGMLARGLSSAGQVMGGMAGGAAIAAGGVAVLGTAFFKLSTVLAEAQDKYALLEARMKNAIGTTSGATQSLAALYDQTQKTGLGFDSAADAFLRIARNAESLGATQGEILQLSDTIAKLGKASGASTGEIQSGMVQLGQALASGRLNGDELRSIMENMPALAKAIADGLGVSVGQIRALGAAGELTSDKVFKAILNASGKANEEFAKLPDTVAQANQRTADAWDKLLATLGERWDSSSLVRNSTNWLAGLINGTNDALKKDPLGQQIQQLEAKRERFAALPGVNSQREVASIDSQLAALRTRAQGQVEADGAALAAKEVETNRAFIARAIELGQNEYADFQKKVDKSKKDAETLADTIGAIQIRIKTGIATDADRSALPALTRQASIAQAEYEGLATGLDKARKSLTDFQRAQAMGGGGGGTSIVSQAIQQQRDAQRQQGNGAGSLGSFVAIGVADAAAKAQGEIETLNRQAEAQGRLQGSVGASRDALRELEIAQAAADWRFSKFGTITTPEVEKAVAAYTKALRDNRSAQDGLADSRAFQSMADQAASVQAQIAAVTQGAYAMRRAAAEASASAAERQTPGMGVAQLGQFDLNERLGRAQERDRLRRETERTRALGDAAGDPARLRDLQLGQRIEDASRQFGTDMGGEIRAGDDADRTRQLQEQTAQLNQQLRVTRERGQLVGVYGEQLTVQTALLERRQALEAQGVSLTSSYAQEQMRVTEELAKQQYELQRQQSQAAAYERAWQNAADGIQSALSNAFETVFTTGKISGTNMLNALGNLAAKVASQMLSAMIQPAIDPLVAAARSFGQSLIPGAATPTGSSQYALSAPTGTGLGLKVNAMGGVYDSSSLSRYSNGIYDTPRTFAFANGAGIFAEAGPEAIMPLARGANGKLGVEASGGGGGVTVIVNDQRSSSGAEPVGVQESKGPDGQRMIQILVRDEVRRAIRSGDLDKDMGQSFGNRRQLVTR